MKFIGWVSWTLMDIYIIAAMKFLQVRGQRRCTGLTRTFVRLWHIQSTHGKCERKYCHDIVFIVFISIDFIYVVLIQVQFLETCADSIVSYMIWIAIFCVYPPVGLTKANVTPRVWSRVDVGEAIFPNIDRVIPGWQVHKTVTDVYFSYFLRIYHFDKSDSQTCVTCDLEDSQTGARFVSNQAQGRGHEKRDIWCHGATAEGHHVSPKGRTLFSFSNWGPCCESEYVRI